MIPMTDQGSRWLAALVSAPVLSCLLSIGGCAQNPISLGPPSAAETPGTAPAAPVAPGVATQRPAAEPKASGVAEAVAKPAPQIKGSEPTTDTQGARGPDQGQRMIVSFRSPTVIIYESEHSNVGQRVPVTSLTLPIMVGSSDASSSRLPITMVEGTRWLAKADVMLK